MVRPVIPESCSRPTKTAGFLIGNSSATFFVVAAPVCVNSGVGRTATPFAPWCFLRCFRITGRMLPTFAYFLCLLGITPAAAFGLAFWGVAQVANSGGLRGLGRILLQLLELAGSPPKLIAIVLVLLAIVLAGCFRSTRPAGCIVLGLLGAVSIVQVLCVDRSVNAWILMTPSVITVVVSFWWAWTMMSAAPASYPGVGQTLGS